MSTLSLMPIMVQTLGQVRVSCPERPATERFRTRKCVELLGLLVRDAGASLSREFLGETLWPNEAAKIQRNRLRYELCQLRPLFAPTQLQTCGHDLVSLSISSDYSAFETAARYALRLSAGPVRQEALEAALNLYTGEFLPGHYAEWILDERNRLETLHDSLLTRLCADYQALGQPELAAYWSQKRL